LEAELCRWRAWRRGWLVAEEAAGRAARDRRGWLLEVGQDLGPGGAGARARSGPIWAWRAEGVALVCFSGAPWRRLVGLVVLQEMSLSMWRFRTRAVRIVMGIGGYPGGAGAQEMLWRWRVAEFWWSATWYRCLACCSYASRSG
jgi:hypothetical protein